MQVKKAYKTYTTEDVGSCFQTEHQVCGEQWHWWATGSEIMTFLTTLHSSCPLSLLKRTVTAHLSISGEQTVPRTADYSNEQSLVKYSEGKSIVVVFETPFTLFVRLCVGMYLLHILSFHYTCWSTSSFSLCHCMTLQTAFTEMLCTGTLRLPRPRVWAEIMYAGYELMITILISCFLLWICVSSIFFCLTHCHTL